MPTIQYKKLTDKVIQMNSKITSESDVIKFIRDIYQHLQLNFHPDDPFISYVDNNSIELFSELQASKLDNILAQCIALIGEDKFYDLLFKLNNEIVWNGKGPGQEITESNVSDSNLANDLKAKDNDNKSEPLHLADDLDIKDTVVDKDHVYTIDLQKLPAQIKESKTFRYITSKSPYINFKNVYSIAEEFGPYTKIKNVINNAISWFKNTFISVNIDWKNVTNTENIEYSIENGFIYLRMTDNNVDTKYKFGEITTFNGALNNEDNNVQNGTVDGVLYKEFDNVKYCFNTKFDFVDGKLYVNKVDFSNMFVEQNINENKSELKKQRDELIKLRDNAFNSKDTKTATKYIKQISKLNQEIYPERYKNIIKENIESKLTFKDLPENTQELVDAGKVTYRGAGMGKYAGYYKLKVNGKEYFVTIDELTGFEKNDNKIRFAAPYRRNESIVNESIVGRNYPDFITGEYEAYDKETLEQAAEHYAHNYFDMHDTNHYKAFTNDYKALKQGFRAGSTWQEKRMYSEQQMDDAYDKETLEQAAEHYAHNYFDMHDTNHYKAFTNAYKALKQGFRAGSTWQEKRMYSEQQMDEGEPNIISGEELYELLENGLKTTKNVEDFIKFITDETSELSSEDQEKLITWYNKNKNNEILLTYIKTDEDTGNFIYKGSDNKMYVSLDGDIYDMTDEGEPDSPVHNVKIASKQPIYNPEDRFGRNPGSKIQEYRVSYTPGLKAKISAGSGIDSNKIVTIVSQSRIKLGSHGVPTNVTGAYKAPDWSKEVAIQYSNGQYGLMFKNRLTIIDKVTNESSDLSNWPISVMFIKDIVDVNNKMIPMDTVLDITFRNNVRVVLNDTYIMKTSDFIWHYENGNIEADSMENDTNNNYL